MPTNIDGKQEVKMEIPRPEPFHGALGAVQARKHQTSSMDSPLATRQKVATPNLVKWGATMKLITLCCTVMTAMTTLISINCLAESGTIPARSGSVVTAEGGAAPQTTEALRPPMIADFSGTANNKISPFLGGPGSKNPLPQHGNINGGVDRGSVDVGIIYAMRLYTGNFMDAIDLAWYIPSNPDNFYRVGDQWGSTANRIGGNGGVDRGWYYCPSGYVVVGLEGASGTAAVDRLGAICGQINAPGNTFTLPVFGGNGGSYFSDTCGQGSSMGFMTGVRVRSGDWMDSIQGLCRASN